MRKSRANRHRAPRPASTRLESWWVDPAESDKSDRFPPLCRRRDRSADRQPGVGDRGCCRERQGADCRHDDSGSTSPTTAGPERCSGRRMSTFKGSRRVRNARNARDAQSQFGAGAQHLTVSSWDERRQAGRFLHGPFGPCGRQVPRLRPSGSDTTMEDLNDLIHRGGLRATGGHGHQRQGPDRRGEARGPLGVPPRVPPHARPVAAGGDRQPHHLGRALPACRRASRRASW